jgi:hypothetical protein
MCESLPPEERNNDAAEAGTAVHDLGAEFLHAALRGAGYRSRAEVVGSVSLNGVKYDDEMYAAATGYADAVLKEAQRLRVFGGDAVGIEQHVKAPSIHAESHGTVDAFLWSEATGELLVADLKFGRRAVSAIHNLQLINYMQAIIDELSIAGGVSKVTFAIYGPRMFTGVDPLQKWSCTVGDVARFVDKLREGAERVINGPATTFSGSHCRDCRAKFGCRSAMNSALDLYEVVEAPQLVKMDDQQLSYYFALMGRAKEQIEYMHAALDEQVKARIQSGGIVPGYKLAPSQGRVFWKKGDDEIKSLAGLMGVPLTKEVLLTPKQARDAGVPEEIVAAYSELRAKNIVKKDDGHAALLVFSRES